jgi:hypothetical protein
MSLNRLSEIGYQHNHPAQSSWLGPLQTTLGNGLLDIISRTDGRLRMSTTCSQNHRQSRSLVTSINQSADRSKSDIATTIFIGARERERERERYCTGLNRFYCVDSDDMPVVWKGIMVLIASSIKKATQLLFLWSIFTPVAGFLPIRIRPLPPVHCDNKRRIAPPPFLFLAVSSNDNANNENENAPNNRKPTMKTNPAAVPPDENGFFSHVRNLFGSMFPKYVVENDPTTVPPLLGTM